MADTPANSGSAAANASASRPTPAAGPGAMLAALHWLPLVFLWWTLIDHLRVEWTVNPQYNYGWAVPFISGFLLWRACRTAATSATVTPSLSGIRFAVPLLLAVLALAYLPTRLVQEANPEWRLVSWALALITVGSSFAVLARVGIPLSAFRFPLLFFLVAVPWPTVIEAPVIQWLATFNATAAAELLNLAGVPAICHVNVIEIGTGLVGVEDACSGIRSLQACLMIGLFLGAYYRLSVRRRAALVFVGFALAVFFNLARTVLLVAVADAKGTAAIAQWHDPAGIIILVGCFLGVWAVAAKFSRVSSVSLRDAAGQTVDAPLAGAGRPTSGRARAGMLTSFALIVWLVACEVFVQSWYGRHESTVVAGPTWTVEYPAQTAGYREIPFSENVNRMLRFDEGRNAIWPVGDMRTQIIFLRWDPGRVAVHLARSHTPEVCLTMAGHKLAGGLESRTIPVGDLALPFDVYHAANEGLWVYYCLWEDGFSGSANATERLTYQNRLRPVLEGRRNRGQRSLEIAIWSNADAEEVHSRVTALVQSIVRVQPSTPATP